MWSISAVAEAGEQTDVGAPSTSPRPRRSTPCSTLDGRRLSTTRIWSGTIHHPGLTERVASFGRSPTATLALCVLFGVFIAAGIMFVTPADAVLVAKQVLVWLTLTLLACASSTASFTASSYCGAAPGPPSQALMPQTDLAILNWRREKSVFLGTNQPQEDASWIFQLRMAELERAKSGRTSEPRPWHRLAARLFDYAHLGHSSWRCCCPS